MAAAVRRVILVSGKLYYELAKRREELAAAGSVAAESIALLRVEDLSPFPTDLLRSELQTFPGARVRALPDQTCLPTFGLHLLVHRAAGNYLGPGGAGQRWGVDVGGSSPRPRPAGCGVARARVRGAASSRGPRCWPQQDGQAAARLSRRRGPSLSGGVAWGLPVGLLVVCLAACTYYGTASSTDANLKLSFRFSVEVPLARPPAT